MRFSDHLKGLTSKVRKARGDVKVRADVSPKGDQYLRADRVVGDIGFRSGGSVSGHVQGNVVGAGGVVFELGSEVDGNVRADSVANRGKVVGEAHAEDMVAVSRGGILKGKCVARGVIFEEGADVDVNLKIGHESEKGGGALWRMSSGGSH